jgi:hypothetical protein
MRSIGLRRWYINVTIAVLDIIHGSVFYLKHDVSDTGFCLRPQMKPTQSGPNRSSFYLWCPQTETIYGAQLSRFHLKTETDSCTGNVVFYIRDMTTDKARGLIVFRPTNIVRNVKDYTTDQMQIELKLLCA